MKTQPNSKPISSKLKMYAAARLASLLLMGGAYAGGDGYMRESLIEDTREFAVPTGVHKVSPEPVMLDGQHDAPSVIHTQVSVTQEQVDEFKKNESTYAQEIKDAWLNNEQLKKIQQGSQQAEELMQKGHDLAKSIHQTEDELETAIASGVQRAALDESTVSATFKKPSLLKQSIVRLTHKEEENILCLDGGGMRGVGTLTMLAALEMKTGKKTFELFDRIYGTSTGGLAAIMLARGYSAVEVLNLYLNEGKIIFGRSTWDMVTNPAGLMGAAYNAEGLESVIKKYVGDATLSDVKIPVAVTSVNSENGSLRLLSSEDEETRDVTMLEAGRATSAAPTYFPARKVRTKNGEFMAVDGGVGFNNPAAIAFDHAREQYKAQGRKVRINMLSAGTGTEEFIKLDKNAGKLGFGNPGNIPGYFMGIKAREVEDRMLHLHAKGKLQSYARIQFGLNEKIDLADYSEPTMKRLQQIAWERAHEKDMLDFAKFLSKQKKIKVKS